MFNLIIVIASLLFRSINSSPVVINYELKFAKVCYIFNSSLLILIFGLQVVFFFFSTYFFLYFFFKFRKTFVSLLCLLTDKIDCSNPIALFEMKTVSFAYPRCEIGFERLEVITVHIIFDTYYIFCINIQLVWAECNHV